MSASDSAVALSQVDGSITIYDGGTNSLTLAFVQSDIEASVEGQSYAEAMVRGQHAPTTPVLRITGDGNVTGSLNLLISSFKGDTAVTPFEVVTLSGLASTWVTNARGDKKALKVVITITASAAAGATQTLTYNYCVFKNAKVSPGGANGLYQLSCEFTDHENIMVAA